LWYDIGNAPPDHQKGRASLASVTHYFENDAETMLEAMGLSRETLAEVCRRGLAQYLTATPFHPCNAAGLLLYLELVQSLRQQLVLTGWEQADESLALTINEELGLAIATRSGDVHTGDPDKVPWFKYPESTTMEQAISGNARQLGLFDGVPGFAAFATPSIQKRVDFNKIRTWWLLHYVDTSRGVMRAELSLPVNIGEGETDQWETRIILDEISFDEEPDVNPIADGDSDLNIPVRKKA